MNSTIEKRQVKEKELIIGLLKKTPIVQIACEKSGLSRATYYRWRKDDSDFLKQTDGAIYEGNLLINDMAESQLISAIRDKNMTGIIFWLKNHHPAYTPKLELTKPPTEELTVDQKKTIEQTLKLLGISDTGK